MKWSRKADLLHFLLFLYTFVVINYNGGNNMLPANIMKRINELSKSKTSGLSVEEAKEQTQLRKNI